MSNGATRSDACSSPSGCRRSATSATNSIAMNNGQIAQVLDAIGQLLEFKDENPFKVRAYHNAARAIESLTVDLSELCRDRKLCEVPGIGKAMEEKITELVQTGKLGLYDELCKEIPEGVVAM